MPATWGELQAQGVKRCCAMFKSGKRCRARAVSEFENAWCAKHGPIIKIHTDFALKAIREECEPRCTECDEGDD
jgi:hypothetical protein